MRLLACLIVAPQRGYDEPAILSYAISSFCPTSADGLHIADRMKRFSARRQSAGPTEKGPTDAGFHPSKLKWFRAADREMQAETFAYLSMKGPMAEKCTVRCT
jgi:hypothetical protein